MHYNSNLFISRNSDIVKKLLILVFILRVTSHYDDSEREDEKPTVLKCVKIFFESIAYFGIDVGEDSHNVFKDKCDLKAKFVAYLILIIIIGVILTPFGLLYAFVTRRRRQQRDQE